VRVSVGGQTTDHRIPFTVYRKNQRRATALRRNAELTPFTVYGLPFTARIRDAPQLFAETKDSPGIRWSVDG
jgi:hypothetical protein